MENASKALIIAGAILLSVLLITLGIMVYNNAKSTVNRTDLGSEEAQVHNAKFTQYCGKNKSAAEVNALVSAIQANNAKESNSKKQIYIQPDSSTSFNQYYQKTPGANTGLDTYIFSDSIMYDVKYAVADKDANADTSTNTPVKTAGYIFKVFISKAN